MTAEGSGAPRLPQLRQEYLPPNAAVEQCPESGHLLRVTVSGGYDFAVGETSRRSGFELGVIALLATGAHPQQVGLAIGADQDPTKHHLLVQTLRRNTISSQAASMNAVQGMFNADLYRPYTAYDTLGKPVLRYLPPVDRGVTIASDALLQGRQPAQLLMSQHEAFRGYHRLPNAVAVRTLLITGQAVAVDTSKQEAVVSYERSLLTTPKGEFQKREAVTQSDEERQAEATELFVTGLQRILSGEPFTWRGATFSADLLPRRSERAPQVALMQLFGYTRSEIYQIVGTSCVNNVLAIGRQMLKTAPDLPKELLPREVVRNGAIRIHEYGPAPDLSLNRDAIGVLRQRAYHGSTNGPLPHSGITAQSFRLTTRDDLFPAFDARTNTGLVMAAAAAGIVFRQYTQPTLRQQSA